MLHLSASNPDFQLRSRLARLACWVVPKFDKLWGNYKLTGPLLPGAHCLKSLDLLFTVFNKDLQLSPAAPKTFSPKSTDKFQHANFLDMVAGRDRGWGCTVDDGWARDNPQRDAQGDRWRPVGLPAVAQPACQGQDGQAQVFCCSCLNCTLCKSLSAKLFSFARNGGLACAICGCRCGWLHSHWVSSHPHGIAGAMCQCNGQTL